MSQNCVIDAAVLCKLFAADPLSERVGALLDSAQVYAPDTIFAECAAILWERVRQEDYPLDAVRQHLTDLQQLSLDIVPTSELLVDALAVADANRISFSDAVYAALAQRLSLPLVTAKGKLVFKLAMSNFEGSFRALEDWLA